MRYGDDSRGIGLIFQLVFLLLLIIVLSDDTNLNQRRLHCT